MYLISRIEQEAHRGSSTQQNNSTVKCNYSRAGTRTILGREGRRWTELGAAGSWELGLISGICWELGRDLGDHIFSFIFDLIFSFHSSTILVCIYVHFSRIPSTIRFFLTRHFQFNAVSNQRNTFGSRLFATNATLSSIWYRHV